MSATINYAPRSVPLVDGSILTLTNPKAVQFYDKALSETQKASQNKAKLTEKTQAQVEKLIGNDKHAKALKTAREAAPKIEAIETKGKVKATELFNKAIAAQLKNN